MFEANKKRNFNIITATCLFKVYCSLGLNTPKNMVAKYNISILDFSKMLAIVLRNLIAYEYLLQAEIMKIAKLTGN